MKKYLIMLFVLVSLTISACGGNTENNNNENKTNQSENENIDKNEKGEPKQGENQADSKSEEGTSTEDVMEFVTNDHYDTFTRYLEEYQDIGTYVNDETNEEGFNEIDFDGFQVKFAFKLLEDKNSGEEIIGFIAETENNTDNLVAFNADMEILTSEQEQTEVKRGLGQTNPGEILSDLLIVPLDDGTPDSFTVILDPPLKGNDNNGYEKGHFGDPIEMEFHKK